jgi:hypothetical protein
MSGGINGCVLWCAAVCHITRNMNLFQNSNGSLNEDSILILVPIHFCLEEKYSVTYLPMTQNTYLICVKLLLCAYLKCIIA